MGLAREEAVLGPPLSAPRRDETTFKRSKSRNPAPEVTVVFRAGIGVRPDAGLGVVFQACSMVPVRSGNPSSVRYPAVWRRGEGAIVAGEVELGDAGLRLDGRSETGRSERSASYREIRHVRVARSAEERLNGRPTLLLDLDEGQALAIMPLGLGLMAEMAELLADLTAAAGELEQIVVVVPLRRGSAERAKELLAAGPPFEPAEFELDEHEVFVGEREAVFVFRGRGAREALQQAAGEPELWRAGLAWRGLLGGRPRMIERAYHWSRPL